MRMLNIYRFIVAPLLYIVIINSHAAAGGVYSLDKVVIGVTTLNDIYKLYGKATVNRVDAASLDICYTNLNRNAFVVFQSGAMGGFERVTAFKLMKDQPKSLCAITSVDILSMTSGNGVRLGEKRQDFLRKFSMSFVRVGNFFKYEEESKRAFTEEELNRFGGILSEVEHPLFDVYASIEAGFDGDYLASYEVRKIESY